MRFTEKLWDHITPIYQTILDQPFIEELTDGTLPKEKFLFYLKQDKLYLADYSRALSMVSTKCEDTQHMHDFLHFASNAMAVERELHEGYFNEFGGEVKAQKSPACFLYTNYLIATTSTRDHAIGTAALLPCFWIYREVGLEIFENSASNNPYQNWIDTYAGEEFNQSVNRAIEIVEEVAGRETQEHRQAMLNAFVRSSELEWMFWDSAYRKEKWPQKLPDTMPEE